MVVVVRIMDMSKVTMPMGYPFATRRLNTKVQEVSDISPSSTMQHRDAPAAEGAACYTQAQHPHLTQHADNSPSKTSSEKAHPNKPNTMNTNLSHAHPWFAKVSASAKLATVPKPKAPPKKSVSDSWKATRKQVGYPKNPKSSKITKKMMIRKTGRQKINSNIDNHPTVGLAGISHLPGEKGRRKNPNPSGRATKNNTNKTGGNGGRAVVKGGNTPKGNRRPLLRLMIKEVMEAHLYRAINSWWTETNTPRMAWLWMDNENLYIRTDAWPVF
jgi:hypothetical protein